MRRLILLILFPLLLYACTMSGGEVSINDKSTVKYSGTAIEKREASRLGQYLLKQGYFNTFDERVVHLRKEEDTYIVTFIVPAALFKEDKDNIIAGFVVWHTWLQEEVFGYAPTQIIVADEQLQALHTISHKRQ